jgi:hypothetical protein
MLSRPLRYQGIPKHKKEPRRFGLPNYEGKRGDETQCDEHAGFHPSQIEDVVPMLRRGLRAGLIGDVLQQGCPKIIWTIANTGWIFEARLTNSGLAEYHGYPVRPTEAIAEPVFRRFEDWSTLQNEAEDRSAMEAYRNLYGFES